jgi:glucose-1-phosphate thymidylyltransferase
MTTAVIAAAGAGTRLGALARRHSKAMVPIAGRPLIDWGITRLHAAGIEPVVVVAHAGDRPLADFLRAAHPDARLALQHERRGIADALRCALPLLGDDAYLACACDSLFAPAEIAAVAARGRQRDGAAVVGVLEMSAAATATRSAVRLDGERIVDIVEKPAAGSTPSGLVAAPLYWLPRAVDVFLASTAARGGERHVSSALSDFVAAGGTVLAVRLSGRIEITTAEDVERAARALAQAAPS